MVFEIRKKPDMLLMFIPGVSICLASNYIHFTQSPQRKSSRGRGGSEVVHHPVDVPDQYL
jgi:hypothetical protein